MILKQIEEINKIRESAQLVSKTLGIMAREIKPGVDSLYLDKIAEEFILDNNARPGFKGYNNFPNTLCVSVNNQVVHGIPCNKPLNNGDIISVDCGVIKDGYYGDHAYTFKVGHEEPEIPNYGKSGTGKILKDGLVLAIEPMINMGTEKIRLEDDGWTFVTQDGLVSAHFEHNIAIINGEPEILSTFDFIYDELGIDSNEEMKFKKFFD